MYIKQPVCCSVQLSVHLSAGQPIGQQHVSLFTRVANAICCITTWQLVRSFRPHVYGGHANCCCCCCSCWCRWLVAIVMLMQTNEIRQTHTHTHTHTQTVLKPINIYGCVANIYIYTRM